MKTIWQRRLLFFLTSGVLFLLAGCQQEEQKTKANVLFIAIDDMRAELSCYGKSRIVSPNINDLASRGVLFNHAYCQQAVCGPSRLSIMTGMHLETLGVFGMNAGNMIEWRETRTGITSLPEQFRKHGYYAYCLGKIYDYRLGLDKGFSWDSVGGGRTPHFLSAENKLISAQRSRDRRAKKPNPTRWPAFEAYDTTDVGYTDGNTTRLAIEFLENRDPDQAFFLAVGFVKPHLPFTAPKKYWDMYDRKEIDLAIHQDLPEGSSSYVLSDYREIFDYDVASPITDDVARELRHGYMACVSYIDAQVGKLITTLEEQGILDNTIVVLWGDHGFKLGDYGSWAKHTNLECDTRVPLIIRMPDEKGAGTRSNAMVELVDVLPTVCEAAGLPVPENADGQSLLPVFDNPEALAAGFALSQFPRRGDVMGYSIRTPEWRYNEWKSRSTGEILEQELYRMEGDNPMEERNLAGEYPRQTESHSRILNEHLEKAPRWKGKPHG